MYLIFKKVIHLICVFFITFSYAQSSLTSKDAALIKEAFNIQKELGSKVWSNWKSEDYPFLYKTESKDYLINHPNPPIGFVKYFNQRLNKHIWERQIKDTTNYKAAFPVNNVLTVVMTSPKEKENVNVWVLKAVHEMFHLFQSNNSPNNPFQSKYASYNELNFPFNYENEKVRAICSSEGMHLSIFLKKQDWRKIDSMNIKKLVKNTDVLMKNIFLDSLQLQYKKHMEWKEGVARYTEFKIAVLSSQEPSIYKPTAGFLKFYSYSENEDIYNAYNENKVFNLIRFVMSGVEGKTVFYYLGMAKCYLLDRLNPDWKYSYFKQELDNLIILKH
ncbi:hypothetical protein [uncultured Psychroserpens sp.]|uniref:hypothetical protein n=1 Tax=uncultured Psychroserpens sp. TaxID=255436 RepID=UPI0026269EA3|nr:hypothetical protein [uncultured Psychroserpens sp.]